MVYLVTQSKYGENQLGYNPKTSEYIYYHCGKIQWKMNGDNSLLEYFVNHSPISEEEIAEQAKSTLNVWERYSKDCLGK